MDYDSNCFVFLRNTSNKIIILIALSAPARLNVSVGLVTSEQIRFEWNPLTCINATDMFYYYYAVLRQRNPRRDLERRKFYGISSSSVTFGTLLPCTTYDFSLRTVKSVPLEFPIRSLQLQRQPKVRY